MDKSLLKWPDLSKQCKMRLVARTAPAKSAGFFEAAEAVRLPSFKPAWRLIQEEIEIVEEARK